MNALMALTLALAVQEDEALARGQKYLDKVAKAWTASLPQERLLGIYMGRQWIGETRIGVRAAAADSGGAFEFRLTGTLSAAGKSRKMESRGILAGNLAPVRIEVRSDEDGKVETTTITVENGAWKRRTEQGGKTTETGGPLKPGTTMEANLLPLFAPPDDADLTLVALDSKKGPTRVRLPAGKGTVFLRGAAVECALVEVAQGSEAPDRWKCVDGKAVELAAGGGIPVRMRVIAEAEREKKLDEPLDLRPAEKALIGMFLAIKKNDREGVVAAFDFDRMAKEMIPGFEGLTDEKKKEAVGLLSRDMPAKLLGEAMRNQLPDPGLLEETLAAGIRSTEKDGVTAVRIFGTQVWRLAEAKEGDRKGRWLIISVAKE